MSMRGYVDALNSFVPMPHDRIAQQPVEVWREVKVGEV